MVSVIDAHLHVVSADTDRYPMQPGGFGRDWWTGRSVDAEQVGRDLDGAGVDRGVIVQAVGPYRNDNRYARAAVARDPKRFTLVKGAIDATGADPGGLELATLAEEEASQQQAGVRGRQTTWLTERPRRGDLGSRLRHRDYKSTTLFPDHLDALAALVSRWPDVVVTLDHLSFPDLTGGPPYRDAGPLFALAALPAVHLKVTTISLLAAHDTGGSRALVERLVERFGADRVAWGSDHPQSFEIPYSRDGGAGDRRVRELAPAAHEAVLGDRRPTVVR